MPFEREILFGEQWLICHGQMQRHFRSQLDELQREYSRGLDCVWGKGRGSWDALWLAEQYNVRTLVRTLYCSASQRAEQYNVRTLVLEDMDLRKPHVLRRRVLNGLYAVVCPSILCGEMRLQLPNAVVYRGESKEILPILQALRQKNTNGL